MKLPRHKRCWIERRALRSEAEAARRGHGLWDGQVPRLAGQEEENHPAHPGVGEERSAGRHLLPFGLPLGQEARSLHLPQRETAPDQRHRARRTYAALPRLEAGLRCVPDRAKCCTTADARKIPRDLHEDARDIARRKMKTKAFAKSRDERKRVEMRFAHLEDPPRLRADAAQGAFRRTRRVPSRCHRAEPQNARAPDPWARPSRYGQQRWLYEPWCRLDNVKGKSQLI